MRNDGTETAANIAPEAEHTEIALAQHLRCTAVSGQLRGSLCEQLASRPARRTSAGQPLYVVGDRADSIYLVKTGLVKTSRASWNDGELIVQLHGPGNILGELCFCDGKRRESAVVLEPSEIVEIPVADIRAQLQRNPEAALDLVGALSEALAAAHERLHSLAFESTEERLSRTLLLLCDTLGEDTPDGGGTYITHYIRQEVLAQMISARREVVSGLLNRLRERGLISYPRKGQISVHRNLLRAYLNSLARPSLE